MTCIKCKSTLTEDAVFCPFCGEETIQMTGEAILGAEETAQASRSEASPMANAKGAALSGVEAAASASMEEIVPAMVAEAQTDREDSPFCQNCGVRTEKGMEFCANCGKLIGQIASEALVFCRKCGKQIRASSKFCPACGEPTNAFSGISVPNLPNTIRIPNLSTTGSDLWYLLSGIVSGLCIALMFANWIKIPALSYFSDDGEFSLLEVLTTIGDILEWAGNWFGVEASIFFVIIILLTIACVAMLGISVVSAFKRSTTFAHNTYIATILICSLVALLLGLQIYFNYEIGENLFSSRGVDLTMVPYIAVMLMLANNLFIVKKCLPPNP